MKRKIIISLILALTTNNFLSFAQQIEPTISFHTDTHDFGNINEADGLAVFSFVVTNTGATPLIFKNVQASCGCTTPAWPKEPILPGAKGTIVVSYDPQNRPGHFEKQITVTSNADPETTNLYISGEVIPRELTVEEIYPINFDGLRLKMSQVTFSSITPTQKLTSLIDVVNNSDKTLAISFNQVPIHINAKITPEIIPINGKAVIELTYDAAVKDDWGFLFDRISVLINGNEYETNTISVSANIQEDFNALTPDQKLNAPKVEVDNATFDFGIIKSGDQASHDYVLKNNGKSNLIIHKVQPTCGCTIANLKSPIVKPGESTTISIDFNSEGKIGEQNKNISIISNDPSSPKFNLFIIGTIQ